MHNLEKQNIQKKMKEHRQESSSLYAMKLVERIVFYMLGMVGIGVLGAIIKLVIIWAKEY